MAEYVPVEYSLMNMGRSNGNASMIGVAAPFKVLKIETDSKLIIIQVNNCILIVVVVVVVVVV